MKAIEIGYRYAKEHFECPLPIRVERMDATAGHVMIDGNTAAALGCLYAGATVGAWYPITPSTSLMDAFRAFCARHRKDPATGASRLHDRAGRGRARRDRHRDRRDVERRARLHADLRSRHLADGGVHRPRVLRRGAGGAVRRAARRSLDRHADAHAAVRPARLRLRLRTATPGTCCCSRIPRKSASRWRCRRSTSPSACRRRCS